MDLKTSFHVVLLTITLTAQAATFQRVEGNPAIGPRNAGDTLNENYLNSRTTTAQFLYLWRTDSGLKSIETQIENSLILPRALIRVFVSTLQGLIPSTAPLIDPNNSPEDEKLLKKMILMKEYLLTPLSLRPALFDDFYNQKQSQYPLIRQQHLNAMTGATQGTVQVILGEPGPNGKSALAARYFPAQGRSVWWYQPQQILFIETVALDFVKELHGMQTRNAIMLVDEAARQSDESQKFLSFLARNRLLLGEASMVLIDEFDDLQSYPKNGSSLDFALLTRMSPNALTTGLLQIAQNSDVVHLIRAFQTANEYEEWISRLVGKMVAGAFSPALEAAIQKFAIAAQAVQAQSTYSWLRDLDLMRQSPSQFEWHVRQKCHLYLSSSAPSSLIDALSLAGREVLHEISVHP